MTRAWRIEFEGALYHVLSRGNERRDIFFVRPAGRTHLEVEVLYTPDRGFMGTVYF